MRAPALAMLSLALILSFGAEARNCKKGIPCGNSCISASKTCRIGGGPTSTTNSYRSYAAPAAAAGAVGLAGVAGSSAIAQDEVLYAREDTDTLDQPARNGVVNGRITKGTRVLVYQTSGASWVRIPPVPGIDHRWVKRDALQSTP